MRPFAPVVVLLMAATTLTACGAAGPCGRVTGTVDAGGRLTYMSDLGGEKAGHVCRLDPGKSSASVDPIDAVSKEQLGRWSTDGTKVAWMVRSQDEVEHLWLAGADGSGLRELAAFGKPRPLIPGSAVPSNPSWPGPFDWSPDGRQLVYAYSIGELESALNLVDATTGRVRGITPKTEQVLRFSAPAWSPDGKAILVHTRPFSGQASDPPEPEGLYLVAPDGSALHPLAVHDNPGQPVWSPDGRQLVYDGSVHGGGYGLFVMDVSTGSERQLTNVPVDAEPAWSPDGKWIAYSRPNGGHASFSPDHDDIWIVAADGGPARMLVESATRPAWVPAR